MVMIYYRERIQIKIAKGKDACGRVQEGFKHGSSNCPLPMES